jgi:UDP-N-acetyl-2-amino-2-deoxyglucuronate dehydrogenase
MAKPITAAVLTGPGGAHLDSYFSALASNDAVARVGLVDSSGASEAEARQILGAKFTRLEREAGALLAADKPDFAIVSMESIAAPPAIRAALEADCHVLAEKPSCVRAEDFAQLVKLAETKHKNLSLALANRLRPRAVHARKLIRSGALGKIYGVELHIVADQTRLKSPAYHKSWFADKSRSGGGHLMWLGIHWIDLVMHLTGAKITEVAAFTGNVGGQPISVEDSAAALLKFEPGFFGTITSGYYLDKGYHSYIKVWGSHGWLELQPHGEVQLVWYSTKDAEPKVTPFDGPKEASSYTPLVTACVEAAVDPQKAPPINGAESLAALRTVFACYEAAAQGRTQAVGGV